MQNRTFNYKEDDSTFLLNNKFAGIIPAGIYAGFDVEEFSGMTLNLIQDNGIIKLDINRNESVVGVAVSKQGVVITENSDISITLTNGAVGNRWDLIVMNHKFIDTVGGEAATYTVIEGVPNSKVPTIPTVTSNTQVILYTVYIPSGAVDLTNVIFQKSDVPLLGNNTNIALILNSLVGDKIVETDTETARLVSVDKGTAYNKNFLVAGNGNGAAVTPSRSDHDHRFFHVTQHKSGTSQTNPHQLESYMEGSTVNPAFRQYTLSDNQHIIRLSLGGAAGNLNETLNFRCRFVYVKPPAQAYDGYELIIMVENSGSATEKGMRIEESNGTEVMGNLLLDYNTTDIYIWGGASQAGYTFAIANGGFLLKLMWDSRRSKWVEVARSYRVS